MPSTPTPMTPAERHHVRYAAAEVVRAAALAAFVAAATLFAAVLVGWVSSFDSGSDFPAHWLYVLLPLLAAGTTLHLSARRIESGR